MDEVGRPCVLWLDQFRSGNREKTADDKKTDVEVNKPVLFKAFREEDKFIFLFSVFSGPMEQY